MKTRKKLKPFVLPVLYSIVTISMIVKSTVAIYQKKTI